MWQPCLPWSTHFKLSATHIFGPLFFVGNINGHSYQKMLNGRLVSQLHENGFEDIVVLQQDGALAHFTFHVRDYLADGLEEVLHFHQLPLPSLQEVQI
ncbi:hypothetical protein C0J52_25107 [Blattella germanica]|nr:hypothetical protein C0J52_25107 [Blattella germanica]